MTEPLKVETPANMPNALIRTAKPEIAPFGNRALVGERASCFQREVDPNSTTARVRSKVLQNSLQ